MGEVRMGVEVGGEEVQRRGGGGSLSVMGRQCLTVKSGYAWYSWRQPGATMASNGWVISPVASCLHYGRNGGCTAASSSPSDQSCPQLRSGACQPRSYRAALLTECLHMVYSPLAHACTGANPSRSEGASRGSGPLAIAFCSLRHCPRSIEAPLHTITTLIYTLRIRFFSILHSRTIHSLALPVSIL